MITTTNTENFRQYKSGFSLIVEQVLVFTSNTNLVKEVKNLSPNFKRIEITMFYETIIRIWIAGSILS